MERWIIVVVGMLTLFAGSAFGYSSGVNTKKFTREDLLKANASGMFSNNYRAKLGGYKDFVCATDKLEFADCNLDCIHNHGAVGGSCKTKDGQGDYNCYCGDRLYEMKTESLHCAKVNDDYREVCTVDCLCNHAATGGTCDWFHRACICHNQGSNLKNMGCKMDNWHDFQAWVHDKLGHDGVGWTDPIFHWFVRKDQPFPDVLPDS